MVRPNESGPTLALVVGAARSGTTLARLLLDAHPELGCPSEAGIPGLMAHLARVWGMIDADEGPNASADPGGSADRLVLTGWERTQRSSGEAPADSRSGVDDPFSAAARDWIIRTVHEPMIRYCARTGKRIYVDKSLDSVYHLKLVQELFPEARFVMIYRHVMDTIASGIEASPWGFNAYGYAPYVQASPGNSVAALASYWLDHVTRAHAWETEHPEACHRVRYEDLVSRPAETIVALQGFLGVEEDPSVLSSAFERDLANGPGDYKVEYTNSVHSKSVGRGKRVPVAMLPPALLAGLNEKLEVLGYAPLNQGWNAAERPVDSGHDLWARRLREMMTALVVTAGAVDLGSFAVLAEDHRELRWVIDAAAGTVLEGDGEVDAVLTGTAEDLALMLADEENLGVLLRSGRVRHIIADEDAAQRRDIPRELNSLVDLLRRGLSIYDESVVEMKARGSKQIVSAVRNR